MKYRKSLNNSMLILITILGLHQALHADNAQLNYQLLSAAPQENPKKETTFEDFNRTLNSAYIPVYGEANLFKNPLPQKALSRWQSVLKELTKFIEKNSYGSQVLKKAMNSLIDLSHAIENTIKVAQATKAVHKSTKSQRDQLAKFLLTLQQKVKKTQIDINAAKKEIFFLHRSSRNQARQLLINLWNILETIAQKVNKNALTYKP